MKLPTQHEVHQKYAKDNYPDERVLRQLREKSEAIMAPAIPKVVGDSGEKAAVVKPSPRLDALEAGMNDVLKRLDDQTSVTLALAHRIELLETQIANTEAAPSDESSKPSKKSRAGWRKKKSGLASEPDKEASNGN